MIRCTLFLMLATLVAGSPPLSAQIPGAPRTDRYGISLEAMRPELRRAANDFDQNGATVFLAGHAELTPGSRLQIELPFVFWNTSGTGGSSSSRTFGNPYLGLQVQTGRVTYDLGGRFPLVSEDESAAFLGVFTDLERMEAFLPDVASAQALARIDLTAPSGQGLAVFAGPEAWFAGGDDSVNENEFLVAYGVETSFRSKIIYAGARIVGRMVVSEEDQTFGERSVHQLGAFVEVGSARVRPVVQLRVPLEESMRETSRWTGGVGLRIGL